MISLNCIEFKIPIQFIYNRKLIIFFSPLFLDCLHHPNYNQQILTANHQSANTRLRTYLTSNFLFRRPIRSAQYLTNNYHHHQHQIVNAASSERIEPVFDTSTQRNVTTSAGRTVYLPCRVHNLGDRTVSETSFFYYDKKKYRL